MSEEKKRKVSSVDALQFHLFLATLITLHAKTIDQVVSLPCLVAVSGPKFLHNPLHPIVVGSQSNSGFSKYETIGTLVKFIPLYLFLFLSVCLSFSLSLLLSSSISLHLLYSLCSICPTESINSPIAAKRWTS